MSDVTDPRQVVLVSCRANIKDRFTGEENQKDNIITVAWHMPTSFKPELYTISVGKTRLGCEMIGKSRCFVVNFMPFSLKEKVLFCGTHSGEKIDKFKEAGLTKEESEKIDCPRIKEACAFMECEVVNEIETGDHVIFIGKVLNSRVNNYEKRVFQIKGYNFTTTR